MKSTYNRGVQLYWWDRKGNSVVNGFLKSTVRQQGFAKSIYSWTKAHKARRDQSMQSKHIQWPSIHSPPHLQLLARNRLLLASLWSTWWSPSLFTLAQGDSPSCWAHGTLIASRLQMGTFVTILGKNSHFYLTGSEEMQVWGVIDGTNLNVSQCCSKWVGCRFFHGTWLFLWEGAGSAQCLSLILYHLYSPQQKCPCYSTAMQWHPSQFLTATGIRLPFVIPSSWNGGGREGVKNWEDWLVSF